jgi:hypothetical protein
MWTTGTRAAEHELIAECDAFLLGHYAQYLSHKMRRVPVWAWLNVLAHGSKEAIEGLAAERPGWPIGADGGVWDEALSYLAQELLTQVTTKDRALADVQRLTLVPLELELVGRRGPSLTPATFVASVRRALAVVM